MTKLFQIVSASCLVINILIIFIIFVIKNSLPPLIPLFYGLPVSESQLSPTLGLFVPPLVASLLSLINLAIVKLTRDQFLEKILGGLNVTVTALSAITVIKIILLVGVFQ